MKPTMKPTPRLATPKPAMAAAGATCRGCLSFSRALRTMAASTPAVCTPACDHLSARPTPTDRAASADAELMRRRCFAARAFLFTLVEPALRAANL